MGTPHATTPRDQQMNLRLTADGLAKIDEMRGGWTRAEYVRRAVAYAVKQGKKGPPVQPEPDEIRW